MKKKIFTLFLLLPILIIVTVQCNLEAVNGDIDGIMPARMVSVPAARVFSNATLADDFCDHTVVIVLNREATMYDFFGGKLWQN